MLLLRVREELEAPDPNPAPPTIVSSCPRVGRKPGTHREVRRSCSLLFKLENAFCAERQLVRR